VRRRVTVVVVLAVFAAAGFGAYRFGLLDRVPGSSPSTSPAANASHGAPAAGTAAVTPAGAGPAETGQAPGVPAQSLRQGASLDLPVLGGGSTRKPPAAASLDDGRVLRVGIVGTPAPPEGLPAPRAGFEYIVVDYLVENLTAGTGVELQPAQQLALTDADGRTYQPDRASQRLPCRLAGKNVVPAGG